MDDEVATLVAAGAGLSAAQVANQVRLRAREAVAKYYEGTLVSDDEVMPVATRNICLRAQVQSVHLSEQCYPIGGRCWHHSAWSLFAEHCQSLPANCHRQESCCCLR